MAGNKNQAGEQKSSGNDQREALKARDSQHGAPQQRDRQTLPQAIPDKLLVSLDAKKHGLHATLSSRRAHSEREQDKKAVGRGILTTHPERQQVTAEYEEKSRHRSEQQKGALDAQLDELAELGKVIPGFQLAGNGIDDLGHGSNAFRGQRQDSHWQ